MIEPHPLTRLEGNEPFAGIDARVIDFWRWALGDLRMNTTRPMLAEFLVAKAVGDPNPIRIEWANHDVTSSEGIKIEVKSSGYLQSWKQKKLSTPTFTRLVGRRWDTETASYGATPEIRADVFVVALHTCEKAADYDPLDVSQWEFYPMPASAVHGCRTKSFGMPFVRKHSTCLRWKELHEGIRLAARSP